MVGYVIGENGEGWLGADGKLFSSSWAALNSILQARGEKTWVELSPPLVIVQPEIIEVTTYLNEQLWIQLKKHPDRILTLDHRQFEEFVAELFIKEGYQVELTPSTRDAGRDIIAVNRSGLCPVKCLAECKQRSTGRAVGVEIIRHLFGVLTHEEATYGILVTSSFFTRGAREFVQEHEWRLGLKDYEDLKRWLSKLTQ